MKGRGELHPLRTAVLDRRAAEEALAVERLERAWPLIVGPVLVRYTRPLRIRHHTLFMGCWNTSVISSLRQSAEATWPQVQERLDRFLGMRFQRLEVVPCDPPEPRPERPVDKDPLEAALRKLRLLRNEEWTRGRR